MRGIRNVPRVYEDAKYAAMGTQKSLGCWILNDHSWGKVGRRILCLLFKGRGLPRNFRKIDFCIFLKYNILKIFPESVKLIRPNLTKLYACK